MDKILSYFIEEPEREFHVRELAQLTQKSPTTISKYLTQLKKKGLLLSTRKLHHLLFKAHTEHALFKIEKLAYHLKQLHSSGLISTLTDYYNHPEAIVLFGSFAKAESIPHSDIDLLIITPLKKEMPLAPFEKKLSHTIQLFLHSSAELQQLKIKNKELCNNMLNGITLEGFWEVLR
jgi:predicted nucleotidyltransferase